MSARASRIKPAALATAALSVLVLAVLGPASAARPAAPAANSAATKAAARAAYAKLPLAFVPNRGQHSRVVRYAVQGAGFGFFFTKKEARLSFSKGKRGSVLGLRFKGASPRVRLEGTGTLPGRVNYFVGRDPAGWHTNLPTYRELRYRGLWPGIDLVLRGARGELKYEFHVQPGARASDIRLVYRGASGLSLGRSGALRIRTPLGVLTDAAPRSYQLSNGTRTPVASRYLLQGRAGYGFALGRSYDPTRPLVIDPGLAYSTYLGGTSTDFGFRIAVDSRGNAYVSGTTNSPDFPTTPGAYDPVVNGPGSFDAFVSKLNVAGSDIVYSTFLGGLLNDSGAGLAIDGAGNAVVTGRTFSPDYPTTTGAYDQTPNGTEDTFVAKLSASGSALLYSTLLGGAGVDRASDVALDRCGNAYLSGVTDSPNFPTTAGAYDQTPNGGIDLYVTKLNSSGSALVYSTYLGGTLDETTRVAIAVDGGGNAYVTGPTGSANYPTTPGAYDQTYNGGISDVYITKLNASGSALRYSTFLGGISADYTPFWSAYSIAVDSAGNAYVAGETGSPDFPTTPGAYNQLYGGGLSDAYVTKLNTYGSALVYSTFLGGLADEGVNGIALDAGRNAYVTGFTNSVNYPTTPDAYNLTYNGGSSDAILSKLSASGSALLYSTFLGGLTYDESAAVALDRAGAVYLTGGTDSLDYPTTPGAYAPTPNGTQDAFVTKLELPGATGGGGGCPPQDDQDHDGLTDSNELAFLTLLNNPDTNFNGIVDGNDDANHNGIADEDEDDGDPCTHVDRNHNGVDDEDEDD